MLITGGTGFLGSHCALELLKHGYDVIIVDNFSNSDYSVLENMKKISGKKIICYDIDINNDIDFIFKSHDIKYVIHFAAYKSVGESVEDPLKYYSNNLGGLISLLKCMIRNNVYNLVFSSSATVYGQNSFSNEEAETKAMNPYGRTKLFSEEILRDVSKTGMNVICLRYFNPVGCHASGLIGDNPKHPNNLFPVISSVIKGEKEYLNIYGNDYDTPDGTGIRDYIHVVDLAQGHILACKYFERMENKFEIFNIGTGKGYSVLEIIKEFSRQLGKEIPYKITEKREGDAAKVVADCTKSYIFLEFAAHLSLEDMVRDTLNFIMLNDKIKK